MKKNKEIVQIIKTSVIFIVIISILFPGISMAAEQKEAQYSSDLKTEVVQELMNKIFKSNETIEVEIDGKKETNGVQELYSKYINGTLYDLDDPEDKAKYNAIMDWYSNELLNIVNSNSQIDNSAEFIRELENHTVVFDGEVYVFNPAQNDGIESALKIAEQKSKSNNNDSKEDTSFDFDGKEKLRNEIIEYYEKNIKNNIPDDDKIDDDFKKKINELESKISKYYDSYSIDNSDDELKSIVAFVSAEKHKWDDSETTDDKFYKDHSETYNESTSNKDDDESDGFWGDLIDFLINALINFGAWICDSALQLVTTFMYGGNYFDYNMIVNAVKKDGTPTSEFSEISKEPKSNDGIVDVEMEAGMRKGHKYPHVMYSPEEIFAGIDPNGNKIAILDINFVRKVKTQVDEDGDLTASGYVGQVNGWLKIKNAVASWYASLRLFAIVGLLSVLLYTGIKMMLGSVAKSKAKYKQMLVDWLIGMIIVFSMHFIMAFTVTSIEQLNKLFTNGVTGTRTIKITDKLKDGTERVFYTNLIGEVRYGIQQKDRGLQAVYLGIYAFLVAITYKFTFVYIKREIKMAFLTIIGPIVAFTYPIDKMADGSAQGFNMWLKEYFFNALIQPVHYLLYKVLITTAVTVAASNVFYTVAVLLFISEAEKIFKQIFGFNKGGGNVPGLSNAKQIALGALGSNLINKYSNASNKVARKPRRMPALSEVDPPSAVNADAVNMSTFDETEEDEEINNNLRQNADSARRLGSDINPEDDIRTAMGTALGTAALDAALDDKTEEKEENEDEKIDNSQNNNLDEEKNSNNKEKNAEQEKKAAEKLKDLTEKISRTGFEYSKDELNPNASKKAKTPIGKNNSQIPSSFYEPRRNKKYMGNNKILKNLNRAQNAIMPEKLKSSKKILENAGVDFTNRGGGLEGTARNLFKRGRRKLGDKIGIDRNKSTLSNIARLSAKTLAKGTRLGVQTGVGALAAGLVFSASLADGKANPFESLATGMLAAKATGTLGKAGGRLISGAVGTAKDSYRETKYGVKNANMMKYIEIARNDSKLHEKFVRKYGLDKADEMKERYLQEYVPRGISDFSEFTRAAKYADKLTDEKIKADAKKLESYEEDEMLKDWLNTSKTMEDGSTMTNQERVDAYMLEQENNGNVISAQEAINIIKNEDFEKEKPLEENWMESESVQKNIEEQQKDLERVKKQKEQELVEEQKKMEEQLKKVEQEQNTNIDNQKLLDEEKEKNEQHIREYEEQKNRETNMAEYDKEYERFSSSKKKEIEAELLKFMQDESNEPRWVKNAKDNYRKKYDEEKKKRQSEILSNTEISNEEQKRQISALNNSYTNNEIQKRVEHDMKQNMKQIVENEMIQRYKKEKVAEKISISAAAGTIINNKTAEKAYVNEQQKLKNAYIQNQVRDERKKLEKDFKIKQQQIDKKLQEEQKRSKENIEELRKQMEKELETKRADLTVEMATRQANIVENAKNREIERRRIIEEKGELQKRVENSKKQAADQIREVVGNSKLTDEEAFRIANREKSDKTAASVNALYNIVKSENSKALYDKDAREQYIQDKISNISDPNEKAKQEKYYRNGFKQIAKQRNNQNFS